MAGRVGVGSVEKGVVQTFIRPEMEFVWKSKELALKQGRIGNSEKSCWGLEKSCHDILKSVKMTYIFQVCR